MQIDTKIKVGVIIVDKNEKILLLKEKLPKNQTALWNIVKGSYDGKETIFEAAKRECLEEASLDIEITHSLGVYISEEINKIRVQFNFIAEAKHTEAKLASAEDQSLRNEAIEELRWFTKEEIGAMHVEDFVSTRTHELVQDWLSGKSFPTTICKQVRM